MKKSARKFLIFFCLAVLLPAAAFSESTENPGDTGLGDRIAEWWDGTVSRLAEWWDKAAPRLDQAVQRAWMEINEPPKVIDRIQDPDAWPDFAFDGEGDLLEIWFPCIRDQDAAIFRYQDQIWMIDCGDVYSDSDIVPLLQSLGITRIDRVFNTHPHHDHLNGFYRIDKEIPIKELLLCFPDNTTRHQTALMEYCKGNDIPVTSYEDESVFPMGDGLVSFLAWLKVGEDLNLNNRSAQFMVAYGQCNILFMADIERPGQAELYEAVETAALKADILRYPHHGKDAMVDDLYDAVDPALVIVTSSRNIPEIHESTRFLTYREANAAYTKRADSVLHLTTDGTHWLCDTIPYSRTPLTRTTDLPAADETEDKNPEETPAEAETEK